MVRLPIDGTTARWRTHTGFDEVTLAESLPGLRACAEYADLAIIQSADGPVGPTELAVGDLDVLIIARRRDLLGDEVTAETDCPECGATVDVRFSLAAYADHHSPTRVRTARAIDSGWWRLSEAEFRLPTVGDVLSLTASGATEEDLFARCVRGALTARSHRAITSAMSRLGPTLRATVGGVCPDCLASLTFDVDARELCMGDLRTLASRVFPDVHLLATSYGWSQDEILALPTSRRRAYAELISGRGRQNAFEVDGVLVG